MTGKDTVLVTGGSGLVGRAINDEIEFRGAEIRDKFNFVFLSSKDADLTNPDQTSKIFEIHKPSYVINLAAKVGGLYANMNNNDSFYRINMSINENVLKCSYDLGVKKCISCLSTCIFPAETSYPLDETKIHLGPPHESNSGYSLAKRHVDLLNKEFNRLGRGSKNQLFTSVIPTNIYGRFDNFSLEDSHVIPGIVHKAYLSVIEAKSKNSNETSYKVYGSGKPLRQFIYAPDFAKLIIWALENYQDEEPLILCPDISEEISIGHIAETITGVLGNKLGVKITIEYDTSKSDGQCKKTADNRKFRSLFPGFQFTPFQVGIQEVIDWFCSSYPDIRR